MSETLRKLAEVRNRILIPSRRITVTEWADRCRCLSAESSAKAGRWKTKTVEVSRGVMDAYSSPSVHQVTIKSCTQLLKTEIINNCVGYHIAEDPCPMLVVQPNEKLGGSWVKDRFDPMCRDTPALKGKVRGSVSHKSFMGGILAIAGSNSPSDLSMRPIRIAYCDEIDKYPTSVGEEGDPIALIRERQASFWDRKLVVVCSPTVEGKSRIEDEYQSSDKRRFNVKCFSCGCEQVMEWVAVKWEKSKPETAKYHCIECDIGWSESDRIRSISNGRWIATAIFKGHAGFHVTKLSSPWEAMPSLATKFLDAQSSREKLKVFVNTQLAETWKDHIELADFKKLYNRRESYDIGDVPPGGLVLTAGADVQKNRIELEIVAWGRGLETWSVDYIIIPGSIDSVEVKQQLISILNKDYLCDNKYPLKINKLAIDTGYNTQAVYYFCRLAPKRIIAVKGMPGASRPIISPPKVMDVNSKGGRMKGGILLWSVGTYTCKDEIFEKLNLEYKVNKKTGEISYPLGYCHYPDYELDYFKMLCSEVLTTVRDSKGYDVYIYKKIRLRNEALDCRVYSRAAASVVGIDRFLDKNWLTLERKTGNRLCKSSASAKKKKTI